MGADMDVMYAFFARLDRRNALFSCQDPVVPEEAATEGAEGTGTREAAASTPAVPRDVRITLAI